ncbi:MAG: PAS domain S-box protein, partial [Nitrospinae bacterium]|nr:PAS domain S-box protein [Nitrospinota bacterium]
MKKAHAYIDSLTISHRMAGYVAGAIVCASILGLLTFMQLGRLAELSQKFYEDSHITMNTIKDMKYISLYMSRALVEIIHEENPNMRAAEIAIIDKRHTEFLNHVRTLRKLFEGDQRLVSDAEAQYLNVIAYNTKNIELLKTWNLDDIWKRTGDDYPGNPSPQLMKILDQISSAASGIALQNNRDVQDAYHAELRKTVYYLSGCALFFILAVFLFIRSIIRPLIYIRGSIVKLSEGQLDEVISYQNLKNEIGDIARGVATIQAVYRHNREQELASRENEEMLRGILDTSPVSIVFSGNDGIVRFTNPKFIKTFGGKVGEHTPQIYANPQDRQAPIELLKRDGIVENYEIQMLDKERQVREMLVTYIQIKFKGEDGILGWLMDITARKQAEEALLKAGALQSAIFNSANFSSIATDAKGVIQIFNVGAERMLGYTAADVMNKNTPADISDPQEVIARAKALSAELDTTITPGFEALVFKASRGIEDIYELTYIR